MGAGCSPVSTGRGERRRQREGIPAKLGGIELTAAARRVLAAQYGVVARQQLVEAGMPSTVVEGLVRRRGLEIAQRGVYRVAGSYVPPQQAAMAAVLRAGAGARLAGEHALALYHVERACFQGAPTVLVPPGRSVRSVRFKVLRTEVPACDRAIVSGVPTLRIERAVLELARAAPDRRVLEVVDSARWLRLLRRERLVRRARGLPMHPGARRVLALLGSGVLGPESFGERDLQVLLAGLPGHFEWGVDDVVPGVRFDAYERAARLALEYDGERHHTAERDAFADRSRELRVREAGIELLRITKDMLRSEREVTRSRIGAILRARLAATG